MKFLFTPSLSLFPPHQGRSFPYETIKTGNEDKAKTAYANVEKIATGSLAAEALYYNGYFKNKEGKYEASLS